MYFKLLSTIIVLLMPFLAYAQQGGPSLYSQNCAACHGSDASGNGPSGIALSGKPLKSLRATALKDKDIKRVIRNGMKNKSGKMIMPNFTQRQLSDGQIEQIIDFLKKLK